MNAPFVNRAISPFFEWTAVDDFAQNAKALAQKIGDALITNREYRKLQEAQVLADFAVALGYQECRLAPLEEEFPDAQVRNTAGQVLNLEITEVMEAGRKRDQEYRQPPEQRSQPTPVGAKQLGINSENWLNWFLDAVKKKLKYGPTTPYDIVVYNNIFAFDLPQMPSLPAKIDALIKGSDCRIGSVWHYRANAVHRVWPTLEEYDVPGWRRSL